ncbi:hypothetical protein HNQ46_000123 [Oribacterium sinus]|uniref:Uncharacterized protein n=1 Tax=Oribacterium sinus TaxID=237576 RepID=A0A7W9SDI2_9FIRM|nr:hypothetical protein [Oribacterium sinus]MBB6040162.1 hypothetical protein [Oribacterium sinus]
MGIFRNIKEKIKDFFYITKEKIKSAIVKVKNALTQFFQKAIDMMKKVIEKIAIKVRGVVLGASHFFRKVGNKYQEGTKNYSLEEELGEWNETTVTKEIELENVPPKYRTLDDEFEVDDTRELDEALAC